MKLRIEIDPMRLDEELKDHALQYHHWAEACANTQADLDKAKTDFDLIKARLDQNVRENPNDYTNAEKITEGVVNNAVMCQPEYAAALRKITEAKRQVKLHEAAVNALEHRKRTLSLLVELWIREYYATPQHGSKEDVRSRGRRRRQEEDDHNDVE